MIAGFPPIARRDARVLIVGSMPGEQSLLRRQYYANPHNVFWRIMAELIGVDAGLAYARRCAQLREAGIALWDVVASCERDGSLDSAIVRASIVANDFAGFFARHRRIEAVLCNGGTAHALYRRLVLPTLPPAAAALPVVRLPSTSPAHAARTLRQKAAAWQDSLRR